MRVTRRVRGDGEGERGAVAVFVAISLIAIIAFAVLTVDVGGLLYRRRAMVNASDAAALAAAQSCALTTDTTVPEIEADQNAALNLSGLQPTDGGIIDSSGCDLAPTGHVTTSYTTTQPLYFGEVIGLGNQRPDRCRRPLDGPDNLLDRRFRDGELPVVEQLVREFPQQLVIRRPQGKCHYS